MKLNPIYTQRIIVFFAVLFLFLWLLKAVNSKNRTNREQLLSAQLDNLKRANDAYFSGNLAEALVFFQKFDSLAQLTPTLSSKIAQYDSLKAQQNTLSSAYIAPKTGNKDDKISLGTKDRNKYYKEMNLDSLWEWAKSTERSNLELSHQAHLLQEKVRYTETKIKKLEDSLASVSNVSEITFTNRKGVKVNYFGETQGGQANGKGIGFYEGGGTYTGQWRNNSRNGQGRYVWRNGDEYEGEYKNGERYGYGTYTFKSGEKYVGEWKNDLREGQGTLFDAYGQIKFKGLWRKDKFTK